MAAFLYARRFDGYTVNAVGVLASRNYVLYVDLSDIQELVYLQRRCVNNLNQVAMRANSYVGI